MKNEKGVITRLVTVEHLVLTRRLHTDPQGTKII